MPYGDINLDQHWPVQSLYPNQCRNIINWTQRNKVQWNFNRNTYIFIQENAFENVWQMAAILPRHQCVKYFLGHTVLHYSLKVWLVYLSKCNRITCCMLLTLHLSESHVFVLLESLGTGGGSGSQHWVRKLTASVASPFRSSNMELTLEKNKSTFDISIRLFTLLTSRAHLIVQSVVLTVENQERNLVFQSDTIFSKSLMA